MPINFSQIRSTAALKTTEKTSELKSDAMMSVPTGFKPAEPETMKSAQKGLGAAIFSGISKFQATAMPSQKISTQTENAPQTKVSSETKGIQSNPNQVLTENKSESRNPQVTNDTAQPSKTESKPTLNSMKHFIEKRLNGETSSKSGSVIPSRFRTHMGLGKEVTFSNINPMANKSVPTQQSSENKSAPVTENRPPIATLGKNGKVTPPISLPTENKTKPTESMATEKPETRSIQSGGTIQDIHVESGLSKTASLDLATSVVSDMSVQSPKETVSLSESGGIDTGKSVSENPTASLASQVDTVVANLPAQLAETAAPIVGETNSEIDQATDNFLADATGSLPENEKTEIKAKAEEFTTEVKDKLKSDIDGVIGSIAEKLTDKATGMVNKAAEKLKTAANAKIDFYQEQLKTATKEGVAEITQAIADEIGLGKVGNFLAGKASDGIGSMTDELIGKLATKLSSEIDKQISTLTDTLNTQISDTIDGLKRDLEATVNTAIDTLADKSGMTNTLASMGESLVNSLPPDKQALGQAFVTTTLDIATNGKNASLTALKNEVKTSVSESLPKPTFEAVEDVGGSVVGILESTIGDQTKEVLTELKSFLQAPLNSILDSVKSQMNEIGNDLVQGMLSDVKAGGAELSAEMKATVDTNLDAFLTKMDENLGEMMDSFLDQSVSDSGSKPSFEKLTETVVGDLKERLEAFKAEPKAAKIFLTKASQALEYFVDNPISSVGGSLKSVAIGIGSMIFNKLKETVIGEVTGTIKSYLDKTVIQPAKDKFNELCPESLKKVIDSGKEMVNLNEDEQFAMHDVFQPGMDSLKTGIKDRIEEQIRDRMQSQMHHMEGSGNSHTSVEGTHTTDGTAPADGEAIKKPEMTETMKTMQTVATAATTTFAALGVLQGLSEIKSGYQEIKSIMGNDKLSAFNKLSGIASNSFHMLVGASRVTAGVVTISVVAGASTAGLSALATVAAPATIGFGLYSAGVFMKKAGVEFQASRSFAVADKMLNNQGPSIDGSTLKGKLHNFVLTLSTGKSLDELKTMVSDIKEKYGDKSGEYVKLEQKYHHRKIVAEVVRAGTITTATLAFGGLSALIPLTTPFLGPFALALPIVVGGATALVGFRIAKSPEKAAENIRAEINNKFPELKDPMPNGHVDTTT